MRHLYTKFGHAEQLVAKAMDGGLGVELVALQARHALSTAPLVLRAASGEGGRAAGRLTRGDNPVLMTMELVLEVLDED